MSVTEHMSRAQRALLECTPQRLIDRRRRIGRATGEPSTQRLPVPARARDILLNECDRVEAVSAEWTCPDHARVADSSYYYM